MKHLLLAVFLAAGLCNVSTALECHFCTHSKNDEECNKGIIPCGQNKNSCIVSINVENGLLSKGCAHLSDCALASKHMKSKCCDVDLCNAKLKVNNSSMVTQSNLFLLLGAVVALLHEMVPRT
ncbi:CD59 glycoprotein [Microcaecilia unicolor]|uniref:CD59 glycoprotein-like n=1 Tax=Microcaecilia unicolor TaxID=1415580 RepID=A0A6P7ZHU5_9AMPH|nr:CD59 glycoprotein-like [Microcaecilia unicolor]